MLYSCSLDEANSTRHIGEMWWAHSDTLWQHQCYKHLQGSSYAFQDKIYSYQTSFFTGTSHREEHLARIHWDKGIDCRYLHQASSKGNFWASPIETGSNFYSKLKSIILNKEVVMSRTTGEQGRDIVKGCSLFHWCEKRRERMPTRGGSEFVSLENGEIVEWGCH